MSQDLIVSTTGAAAVARLGDLAGRARAFMEAAKAENSRRAYRSDWRHFEFWCRDHGVVCLPAAPETVALYLTAQRRANRVSTAQVSTTGAVSSGSATMARAGLRQMGSSTPASIALASGA